jgi:hypothetical protein
VAVAVGKHGISIVGGKDQGARDGRAGQVIDHRASNDGWLIVSGRVLCGSRGGDEREGKGDEQEGAGTVGSVLAEWSP